MEGSQYVVYVFTLFNVMTLVVNGKRAGDRDDDNGFNLRPSRTKGNGSDGKPELFAGLPDPETSAQQVSPTVSGYQGGQTGLIGNQGLYGGLQGQGLNPGLGQGQVGLNPYYSGFGTTNLGGGTFGIGTGYQNPYGFQDIYSQQGGLGGGGFGGISTQQGGLGGGGFYNTNPYLTQGGQNPYLINPYLQSGGVSSQFLNPSVNPYLLAQRNPGGYFQNPYLGGGGVGGGGSLGGSLGGFVNPYSSFNTYNPYSSFPLSSRFGLGAGRGGSLGSRSNSAGSSTTSSNDD